jgi:hypothetical protein
LKGFLFEEEQALLENCKEQQEEWYHDEAELHQHGRRIIPEEATAESRKATSVPAAWLPFFYDSPIRNHSTLHRGPR